MIGRGEGGRIVFSVSCEKAIGFVPFIIWVWYHGIWNYIVITLYCCHCRNGVSVISPVPQPIHVSREPDLVHCAFYFTPRHITAVSYLARRSPFSLELIKLLTKCQNCLFYIDRSRATFVGFITLWDRNQISVEMRLAIQRMLVPFVIHNCSAQSS